MTALLLIRFFKPFLGAGCGRHRPRWIEARGGTGVVLCTASAVITQRSRRRRRGYPTRDNSRWPLTYVCSVLVALRQIPVQSRSTYSERPADGRGGLPVRLHPAGKRSLVGIELGGSTELAAGLTGCSSLRAVRSRTIRARIPRSTSRFRPPSARCWSRYRRHRGGISRSLLAESAHGEC